MCMCVRGAGGWSPTRSCAAACLPVRVAIFAMPGYRHTMICEPRMQPSSRGQGPACCASLGGPARSAPASPPHQGGSFHDPPGSGCSRAWTRARSRCGSTPGCTPGAAGSTGGAKRKHRQGLFTTVRATEHTPQPSRRPTRSPSWPPPLRPSPSAASPNRVYRGPITLAWARHASPPLPLSLHRPHTPPSPGCRCPGS
jgi:hypothetical protein